MSEENLTGLAKIRQEFQSPQAINMFKDAMPVAAGRQADEMAKRFAKMTYAVISQNPSLQKCSVTSLIRAASISASLDLDIDARGLAYLVPYGSEANFQIGYLGLIELAYRSGKVKSICAHCIYDSELKNVKITRINGQYVVEHPFTFEKPTGKIVAVYATAIIDGIDPQTMVLRGDEIEFYRSKSKAPNSPAWKEYYEAMAKKTAIRQLAKFLPKSILEEFSRGAAIDEEEERKFVESNIIGDDEPPVSTTDRIKNKFKDKEESGVKQSQSAPPDPASSSEEPKTETPKGKKNTTKKAEEKPKEEPKPEPEPEDLPEDFDKQIADINTQTKVEEQKRKLQDQPVTPAKAKFVCARCERESDTGGKCPSCFGQMLEIK